MSRRSRAALILVLGVIGLVGVGTVTTLASRTAASSFEVALDGRHEVVRQSVNYRALRHTGTFRSGAPFCRSGTDTDHRLGVVPDQAERAFTCEDGIGTRSVPVTVAWRSTFERSEADDSVPPSITFLSAKLSKLRRPPGAYSLRLKLVIRDDVERNPIGYGVVVNCGVLELARKAGTTASGTVSLALRIRPLGARARSVRVGVTAIDPVGNKASFARTMGLPR